MTATCGVHGQRLEAKRREYYTAFKLSSILTRTLYQNYLAHLSGVEAWEAQANSRFGLDEIDSYRLHNSYIQINTLISKLMRNAEEKEQPYPYISLAGSFNKLARCKDSICPALISHPSTQSNSASLLINANPHDLRRASHIPCRMTIVVEAPVSAGSGERGRIAGLKG